MRGNRMRSMNRRGEPVRELACTKERLRTPHGRPINLFRVSLDRDPGSRLQGIVGAAVGATAASSAGHLFRSVVSRVFNRGNRAVRNRRWI